MGPMSANPPSVRYRIILPVMCWNRQRADFYAVTDDVSRDGIRFRSATVPTVDETLTCSIRHIGVLESRIVATGPHSFTVRIAVGRNRSAVIAQDLLELSRQQHPPEERTRAAWRVVPRQTETQIRLESGLVVSGRLLNVSATGAALHLDEAVEVGSRIRIGTTEATVVRCFAEGVGAAFLTPLDPARVTEAITL